MKRHGPIVLTGLILLGCGKAIATPSPTPPPDIPVPLPTARPTKSPTPSPAPPDVEAIARDYPAVDGSTSTLPLQMTVACALLDVPCRWIGGPDDADNPLLFLDPSRRVVADWEVDAPPELMEQVNSIYHFGTHGSYVNLIEGSADLILVARQPSEDEQNLAVASEVTLDVRPVALDAFVFLVNAQNPVDDLSTTTLRDIYAGRITTWDEIGGLDGEIVAFQRDPNSGSQELMEDLVMKGTPMVEVESMILETMMGPINRVADEPAGLGYSVYYYVTAILPDERVSLIAVNGVPPTSETIAARAYPLTTEVYVALRADTPPDSTAAMLRDWLLTDEGQAVVAESGYVPYSP